MVEQVMLVMVMPLEVVELVVSEKENKPVVLIQDLLLQQQVLQLQHKDTQ